MEMLMKICVGSILVSVTLLIVIVAMYHLILVFITMVQKRRFEKDLQNRIDTVIKRMEDIRFKEKN